MGDTHVLNTWMILTCQSAKDFATTLFSSEYPLLIPFINQSSWRKVAHTQVTRKEQNLHLPNLSRSYRTCSAFSSLLLQNFYPCSKHSRTTPRNYSDSCVPGPVAQWIRRLTTDQEILGSTPGRVGLDGFFLYLKEERAVAGYATKATVSQI